MWKLKVAEAGNNPSPWRLRTLNDHIGRQIWEFCPDLGSPEDIAKVKDAQRGFTASRSLRKHSSDLLLSKENPCGAVLPGVIKVKETEEVREEIVTNTLRRAFSFYSSLQLHDGHWPADNGGPMFLLPGLIITLSINGTLNVVLTEEHKKEIYRYLYNHQVLNMLCCWVENPYSEAFKLHLPRVYDYLWIAEDGTKMQGSNGSQLWDTALAGQAIISTNLIEEYSTSLIKAHAFFQKSQV